MKTFILATLALTSLSTFVHAESSRLDLSEIEIIAQKKQCWQLKLKTNSQTCYDIMLQNDNSKVGKSYQKVRQVQKVKASLIPEDRIGLADQILGYAKIGRCDLLKIQNNVEYCHVVTLTDPTNKSKKAIAFRKANKLEGLSYYDVYGENEKTENEEVVYLPEDVIKVTPVSQALVELPEVLIQSEQISEDSLSCEQYLSSDTDLE